MYSFRIFLSSILFIVSLSVLAQLVATGFGWGILIIGMIGLVVASYIWPRKRKNSGEINNDCWWLDVFELAIEFITLPIRAIGKLFN